MFQSEAAIDDACDQDRVLREHFLRRPGATRRKYCHLNWRRFSSRENWVSTNLRTTKRRQHERCRNWRSGSSSHNTQPGASTAHRVGTALRHAGARREAIRFVPEELRCPTCEARPLTLPQRPGMLPRCSRFKRCIGIDLVDLEVRNGISARALNVVCWNNGLLVVQELWNGCTAHAVMSEFELSG